MTTHYTGVQYWTMSDTVAALQMDSDELEALEFVRNVTNALVHCDEADGRYHTHGRAPEEPAPETPFTSLPMCMYGRCASLTPERDCVLNRKFLADVGLSSPEEQSAWFRNSAFMEYWPSIDPVADGLRLNSEVSALAFNGQRVTGVYVKTSSGATYLSCARKAVLLSSGVMGNAPLLLPLLGSYKFFAQPVVVVTDSELLSRQSVCDEGSLGGGTFHGNDGRSGVPVDVRDVHRRRLAAARLRLATGCGRRCHRHAPRRGRNGLRHGELRRPEHRRATDASGGVGGEHPAVEHDALLGPKRQHSVRGVPLDGRLVRGAPLTRSRLEVPLCGGRHGRDRDDKRLDVLERPSRWGSGGAARAAI